jgi:hypothetical protein
MAGYYDQIDKNINGGETFTDELKNTVGASAFQLQNDYFADQELVIRTASGGGGTLLVEDTDYTLSEQNTELTAEVQAIGGQEAWVVYKKITITNVTYQTGDLYFSGKYIADDNSWLDINRKARFQKNLALTDDDSISATSTEYYELYTCNAGADLLRVNLPAADDAQDQVFKILKTDTGAGCVRITPDGSDKIISPAGTDLDYLPLFLSGDLAELYSNGTDWFIVNGFRPYYQSGWIRQSDWTNRELGFIRVAYDNLSGTFEMFEIVTEATSGNTGIIINDTGSELCLAFITGTGLFTDGRQLTGGTSTATADVNESGTGSTKNKNTSIIHNWGVGAEYIDTELFINVDTTFSEASKSLTYFAANESASSVIGASILSIDTNSQKIQTSTDGLRAVSDAGSNFLIDNEDWWYNTRTRL